MSWNSKRRKNRVQQLHIELEWIKLLLRSAMEIAPTSMACAVCVYMCRSISFVINCTIEARELNAHYVLWLFFTEQWHIQKWSKRGAFLLNVLYGNVTPIYSIDDNRYSLGAPFSAISSSTSFTWDLREFMSSISIGYSFSFFVWTSSN